MASCCLTESESRHPNHAERGTAEPRTPTTPNEKKRARDMAF